MTRSAYQISPIWSDSRLRRSKIRFPRIQDYLRVTRPSQITRDISFPDGSDDGHEERVRGNQREREPVTIILASHTRVATTHTTNMASASALAGAFTTFGVSANRAAAKKTNVVAKKVRVAMPSVPNESTPSLTSSSPRVARARRRLIRQAISAARDFAICPIDGDRYRTRDRAIARRARVSRGLPRSVRVWHDCFYQPGNSRRGACQPATPRTLADPVSTPRSIHRLSPRVRQSAPSSVISRYVSAPRREAPEPPPTRPDMFCHPVSCQSPRRTERAWTFRAAAPRDARLAPIPRAAARGGEARVPASVSIRRCARITRSRSPRPFRSSSWRYV